MITSVREAAASGSLCGTGGERKDDGYAEALFRMVEFHQAVILAYNILYGLCAKTVFSGF